MWLLFIHSRSSCKYPYMYWYDIFLLTKSLNCYQSKIIEVVWQKISLFSMNLLKTVKSYYSTYLFDIEIYFHIIAEIQGLQVQNSILKILKKMSRLLKLIQKKCSIIFSYFPIRKQYKTWHMALPVLVYSILFNIPKFFEHTTLCPASMENYAMEYLRYINNIYMNLWMII